MFCEAILKVFPLENSHISLMRLDRHSLLKIGLVNKTTSSGEIPHERYIQLSQILYTYEIDLNIGANCLKLS